MRVGIATDHGGFGLKEELLGQLRAAGHEVVDFGANSPANGDDYPDYVLPLARAVVAGKVSVALPSAAAELALPSAPTRCRACVRH